MSRLHRAFAVLVLLGCFFGVAAVHAEPPQVIFYNAKVFTSDADHLWTEAVAVEGNRIQAVGSNAEVLALAGPETRLLDLGQRTVIPGLNDAHFAR